MVRREPGSLLSYTAHFWSSSIEVFATLCSHRTWIPGAGATFAKFDADPPDGALSLTELAELAAATGDPNARNATVLRVVLRHFGDGRWLSARGLLQAYAYFDDEVVARDVAESARACSYTQLRRYCNASIRLLAGHILLGTYGCTSA